jgi:hypothetical protein
MSNYENGDFKTKYGVITVRNPGRVSAPPNLQTLKRVKGRDAINGLKYAKSAGDVVMQGPALRAFREAEVRATTRRLRRKGLVTPIILTGVGYRSFAVQKALYEGPDNTGGTRFANPNGSLHCEALADDIHTGFLGLLAGRRARKALIAEGFFFAVPGEPWHCSFNRKG